MPISFKRGDSGVAVGALQQALLEAGQTIGSDELNSRSYGPSTEQAVEEFQRANVDEHGRALTVDGVVGPMTWTALKGGGGSATYTAPGWTYVQPADVSVRAVCDAAVADIGKHEMPDGSNSGPDLVKFNTQGRPWCALAVSTWYGEAGSPFGIQPAVVGLVAWGRATGNLVPDGAPALPGDVVCWLRAGGRGHTGLVVGVAVDGSLSTVEGNSRNAVRGVLRPRAGIAALVRPLKGT